jgi:hypothetical protein
VLPPASHQRLREIKATYDPDQAIISAHPVRERSASRAQSRGGFAAAAAFLDRAAALTVEPRRRAERALARRRPRTKPVGSMRPSGCWAPRRLDRSPNSSASRSTCFAPRSRLTRVAATRRRRCCSRRPNDSSRWMRGLPGSSTWMRWRRRC